MKATRSGERDAFHLGIFLLPFFLLNFFLCAVHLPLSSPKGQSLHSPPLNELDQIKHEMLLIMREFLQLLYIHKKKCKEKKVI